MCREKPRAGNTQKKRVSLNAGFVMKVISSIVLIVLLFNFFPAFSSSESKSSFSTLTRKSAGVRQDTTQIRQLAEKGLKVVANSDSLARKYLDSAMLICGRRKIEVPAILHLLNARYNYYAGDLRTASEEALSSIKEAADAKDYLTLARTYLFLGEYYNRTGLYQESIENYDNAISISEKRKLSYLIPDIYLAKSEVYVSLDDMKGQRGCLKNMIDAALSNQNYLYVILGYYNFGRSFCGDSANVPARNFRAADSLFKKAIYYSYEKNDSLILPGVLADAGWNFYLEQMYDSAVYYYKISLKYSLPLNRNYTTVNSYGNLGTIYRDLGKYDQAIDFYNKAIKHAKVDPVKNTSNLWWIYRDMSDLYLARGDTSRAYDAFTLYKKFDDIRRDQASRKGLSDARVRYEADFHRKEVELLSLRLKNNRLLNYGFIGLIALMITMGLLIIRGSKLKNKRRISEMNRKIAEVTQANLRQQMNPHFIFNTLNSIQYYMYQHDKLATNNYLTKFSTLMRKVLDNSRNTSIPLSDELSALRLYLELECIRFKDKFDFKITVDDEIDPLMYKIPTMLIQPYVENSITHGLMTLEGKGFVKIDIRINNDCLVCTVEDNGIGRKAAKERNQSRGMDHNSLGTQITESRLDLVNSLYGTNMKTQYTDLTNENGEASGTRVEIHIPIIS